MKLISVRLPESLIQRVKLRAVRERTNLQELVASALTQYLKTPIAGHKEQP